MISVFSGLTKLEGYTFPTYYSTGAKNRAIELSKIASSCHEYIKELYPVEIPLTLLVLNRTDSEKKNPGHMFELIRGYKNILWYPNLKEENAVYKEMLPYFENGPDELKQRLRNLLPDSSNPFLTAGLNWWNTYVIHEMFHNYAPAYGVKINLSWFDELVGDYVTYAFLKRYSDQYRVELDVSEVSFSLLYKGGHSLVQYNSIADFERLYTGVGAANYCWYHAWFNVGAFELYKMYREEFINEVNELYRSESGFDSTSEQLVSRLDLELEGFKDWYDEWIKQRP